MNTVYLTKFKKKLSLYDNSEHFEKVYVEMHEQVVCDPTYGIPYYTHPKYRIQPNGSNLKLVLDELFSHRHTYQDDPEMQEFFKTLMHVKYDYTRDGDLQEGHLVPDVPLYSPILNSDQIEFKETKLSVYIQKAEEKNRPLVLNCGSWS